MIECKWCKGSIQIGNGPSARPDWKRWRCNQCGAFGYINDPSEEELSQVYETAWEDSEVAGTFAAGATTEKIANSILDAVRCPASKIKCLDYGGGKGQFATALLKRGCYRLTVFEPFGENPGLQGLDPLNWINDLSDLGTKSFDWVFMIETVEHLLDPIEELKKIRQHLAPRGKLVVTTPNAKGWRALVDSFDWREAQNTTHINLFSERALRRLLDTAGFSEVKRIRRPVTYKATGWKALLLSMLQIIGIDGGLRFIVSNGSK